MASVEEGLVLGNEGAKTVHDVFSATEEGRKVQPKQLS